MATRTIELGDLKETLPDLVAEAIGGAEVVITKDHRPVAKLVPVTEKPPRQFGGARGLIEMADDFDEFLEEFREYMA